VLLARRVAGEINDCIAGGRLPMTIGVFGGWGAGKTTFLALLSRELEANEKAKVLYFNAWKYAGMMEIVPSLIYKVLKFGVSGSDEQRDKKAMQVLLSLGREYSDEFGKWAKERVGVDPVKLFKDVHKLKEVVETNDQVVSPEIVKAYYSQVDRAQDHLAEALGPYTAGSPAANPVVVLIDELDRCDPDEAFLVIKQLRVLFAMRQIPIAFVLCANPEPIGLAIKHRYGLDSATGDYESRRILEKFVDSYEDFNDPLELRSLIEALWETLEPQHHPWIIEVDEANGDKGFRANVVGNARAFDVINTSNPLFANLRIISKTFKHRADPGNGWEFLFWTSWHIELADQVDPVFRRHISLAAGHLETIFVESYRRLLTDVRPSLRREQVEFGSDKGRTLFAILRSYFWEAGRAEAERARQDGSPEGVKTLQSLVAILSESYRMDYICSMSLVPIPEGPTLSDLRSNKANLAGAFKSIEAGRFRFAWILANA
jgi:KAP family P-loop domain